MLNAELLFVELFNSLLSLDDELNVAQSVFIYFKFMSQDSNHPSSGLPLTHICWKYMSLYWLNLYFMASARGTHVKYFLDDPHLWSKLSGLRNPISIS